MTLFRPATLLMTLVLILTTLILPQYAKPQTATITTYGNSAAVTAASVNLKPVGAGTGFYEGGNKGFSYSFGPTAAGGCKFTINLDEGGKPFQHIFQIPCIQVTVADVLNAFKDLPPPLLNALEIVLRLISSIGG